MSAPSHTPKFYVSKEFQPGLYGLPSVISVAIDSMVVAHVNCAWGDARAAEIVSRITAHDELVAALCNVSRRLSAMCINGRISDAIRAEIHDIFFNVVDVALAKVQR